MNIVSEAWRVAKAIIDSGETRPAEIARVLNEKLLEPDSDERFIVVGNSIRYDAIDYCPKVIDI